MTGSRIRRVPIAVLAGGAVVLAGMATSATVAAAAPVFSVMNYGAVGNGTTNDAAAVQRAIAAASAAGQPGFGSAAVVEFPPATYVINNTIHLMNNAVIQVDSGATITATSGAGFDPPEPNSFPGPQDAGHSHFNNAMFRGDHVSNIGFTGSGHINGGGHFTTGNPSPGNPDKLISLTNCDTVTLSGVSITSGGHFEVLTNGCGNIVSDHLDVEAAAFRDGWNILSGTNVTITNITIHSNDDALSFKSDGALGKVLPSGSVTVTGGTLSAGCCNPLIWGGETCGDFTGYRLSNLTMTGAGKAGIDMVSMNGGHISNVQITNVTMTGSTQSMLFVMIGSDLSCGNTTQPGTISDVHLSHINATSPVQTWYPTLWGLDPTHDISDFTLDDVHFTVPGGGSGNPDALPVNNGNYNPRGIGPRPAFGLFMHNVNGVGVSNSSFTTAAADSRPMIDAIAGSNICLSNLSGSSSSGGADIHFNGVAGYSTSGIGGLRVTAVGSTAGGTCPMPVPSPSPSPAQCASPGVTMGAMASPAGPGSATVSWTPPSDGGCAIDAYAVYAFSYTGTPQMLETTNSASMTATGLTAGNAYTFTIIAHNPSGWGTGWSGWSPWALV